MNKPISAHKMTSYPLRSSLVQFLCPAPKRHLQRLILDLGLRSALDVGCGGGSLLTDLRRYGLHSTGIDASMAAIEASRSANAHDDYVVGDFLSFDFDCKFDVVVLSHVIEHFPREMGETILRRLEALSGCLVYVETPNGFLEQTDFDGNPYQRHLSGWFPHDFRARGYTVYGHGVRGLTGPVGRPRFLPRTATVAIQRMCQRIVFRRPWAASTIAAIRYLDGDGNLRVI